MGKHVLFAGHYMEGVRLAWEKYGYKVYSVNEEFTKEESKQNHDILWKYINQYDVDAVFSFDYLPGLSESCYKYKIKYISWIWDCPHTSLWHKSSRYETTFVFVFDYVQYQTQVERGLTHIYYLPLSPDIDSFMRVIFQDNMKSYNQYKGDVAFLGNIYNDNKHGMFDQINYLPPFVRGYLDALITAQKNVWGYSLFENSIDESVWEELRKYVMWDLGDQYEPGIYEPTMIDIINKKVAQIERKEMCSYLARHFDFNLYSGADTSFDPAINNKGYAIYDKEMPLIFNYSKINIHITVRSITSGIPLRVMDVLACGGFLLTNYQPEIMEYFEDGVDLVIYQDLKDLYKKIEYYLEHEEERKNIAQNGQKKVRELFHYEKQIGKIIEVLEQ